MKKSILAIKESGKQQLSNAQLKLIKGGSKTTSTLDMIVLQR